MQRMQHQAEQAKSSVEARRSYVYGAQNLFDPNEELVLQVDSSKDGLGAVLMQKGRPLEYASRALTATEQRWAQIEKETLSLVFGLERFDQYTFGRPVQVHNDHKPLATILKKPLSQASRRTQALMMRLYSYDIQFQYKPGTQLFIADTLSRASLPHPGDDVCVLALSGLSDMPDKSKDEVREATQKDEGLQTLLSVITEGWPEKKNDVPEKIRMYFDVRDTLSEQDGVILKGEIILVPPALQTEMKKRLHAAHLGYDSMLRRERELLYWPGMAQDIRQIAESCEACQHFKPQNQKETLKQHAESQEPWTKIGVDLFEVRGHQYLVTVDYFSTFIEVDHLKGTSATDIINKLQAHFARHGTPAEIVSDQGPQFTSTLFKQMAAEWVITHTMSSPHHHQSNSKAEAAVKTLKHMMYKCMEKGENQYAALLELRNTPRQDTGLSPTQMMYGRFTRSRIPAITSKPVSRARMTVANRHIQNRRKAVKRSYDKQAKDLVPIRVGHPVFYRNTPGRPWKKGRVRSRDGEREYTIEGDNGGVYQRNRRFLRPTQIFNPDQQTPTPNPKTPMTHYPTPTLANSSRRHLKMNGWHLHKLTQTRNATCPPYLYHHLGYQAAHHRWHGFDPRTPWLPDLHPHPRHAAARQRLRPDPSATAADPVGWRTMTSHGGQMSIKERRLSVSFLATSTKTAARWPFRRHGCPTTSRTTNHYILTGSSRPSLLTGSCQRSLQSKAGFGSGGPVSGCCTPAAHIVCISRVTTLL
ncbi:hypothetical protein ACOMHN_027461 [Nucella lapillus]